ncbi:MAG TPA: FKBP-type peptidyl-prolyl cis-trans isomerase [Terriglobales bacterium]|nr:FKBP-type peptidyl-prolyl cis-trans isomerase [Terriglobales bacterium]
MRRITAWTLAASLAAATAHAQPPQPSPAAPLDEQKTLYALGVALSQQLQSFYLTEKDLEQVTSGLRDGINKKVKDVDVLQYRNQFQALANARSAVAAEAEKKNSAEFLAKKAAEKGAVKTDSGLIYREITPGKGKQPQATDRVEVHYHGTLADGTVFDSSRDRNQPATFKLNGVIKCWTEGVAKMKEGGKSELTCPSDIAYGDRGSPPKIKPGAALVFEVELLKVLDEPTPGAAAAPAAPGAPGAAPAPAKK